MKITKILLALIFTGFAAQAQHPFTLNGQLAADKQGIIFLDYFSRDKYVLDSAVVKDGKFSFKGTIGDPVYATLNLNPYKGNFTPEKAAEADFIKFFLEGQTVVKSSSGVKDAMIKGGRSQDDYLKRNEFYKPLNEQLAPLSAQMRQLYLDKNTDAMKPLQAQIAELSRKGQRIDSAFIKQHPDSYVAFDIWRSKHKGFAKAEWRSEFERFSPAIQSTEEGKAMKAKIMQAAKLTPGNVAPDFTLKTLSGKEVILSSLRGKNVVVCFWYSSFANFNTFSLYMRRAEKRLKEKNTVFVGINYDDITTAQNVIAENFPDWINLTEAGPNGIGDGIQKVARSYGVYSGNNLPAAFLIGPDGKFLSERLVLNDTELGLKLEKLVK
jgi:peroxiredoxin